MRWVLGMAINAISMRDETRDLEGMVRYSSHSTPAGEPGENLARNGESTITKRDNPLLDERNLI